MTLKPKTVRRLLLLGVVLVLVVGGGLGLLVVRRWQNQRLDARLRADGVAAFERADYPAALDHLGRYLKRQGDRKEPEALLFYARARARLEEPDGKHIVEGVEIYKLYLAMRPDDRDAEVEYLRLNIARGRWPEALGVAARLRPARLEDATEADLPVLREEVRALVAQGSADERLGAVSHRITELAPLELDAHLTYCDWLVRRNRAEEARAWARNLRDAYPSDPRARLLDLLVGLGPPSLGEFSRLFDALCALTVLDPGRPERPPTGELPDEAYLLRVATLLDQIGRHDHAVSLLRAATVRDDMPAASRLAVRRMWQTGRSDWVLDATEHVDPASPDLPADMLGFRALALRAEDRGGEADDVREVLRTRPADFRARAWVAALSAPVGPPGGTPGSLAPFDAAMRENQAEPVFRHFHADALAGVGRLEDAIVEWRAVAGSPLAIGWALPWVRMSQAALELGLVREAVEYAERAAQISPRSLAVAGARFGALVARVERSSAPTGDEGVLLRFVERAGEELRASGDPVGAPRFLEQLLPGRVLLLSRVGRRAEAGDLIDASLGSSPPPERETLERLAIVSIREKLGREGTLLDAAARLYAEAPSTGAVRALGLHEEGKHAEALRMLDRAVADAAPDRRAAWEMTRAAFLDRIGDPGAGPAWIAAADSHPDDLAVQSAALRSPTATRDASFIDRAAGRIAALTGDANPGSSLVRLARARSLLAGRPTARQRDQAVGLIRDVTVDQPRLIEARVLLADALLMQDEGAGIRPDVPGALAELRAAAGASIDGAPLWLRVAELMQRERDFAGARAELLRVVSDYAGDAEVQRRAAGLLVAQGALDDAIPVYESLAKASPSVDASLALGEAYALARRDGEALAVFRRLAAARPESADEALGVAVWLHRLGDAQASSRAIAALDDLPLASDERAVHRARYEGERGDLDAAEARLREALGANQRNADAWAGLVTILLRRGKTEAAGAAVRDARGALPDEPRLLMLERQIGVSSGPGASGLTEFADALGSEPGGAASAEAVRAVSAAMESGRLDSEEGLVALADRFPTALAVQNLVVRRLMEVSPARPDPAARIAERAMASFPASPEPARLAAAAHAALGRWDRALACAEAWRRRDPRRPIEADGAVAEAHLALGNPDRALEVLRPHLGLPKASPAAPESLLVAGLGARALLALGRPDDAYGLLEPLLPHSSAARIDLFIPLVLDPVQSVESGRAWLDRAAPAFPAQPVAERAALALAYTRLGARSEPLRAELTSVAEAILDGLTPGAPGPDAALLEARGALAEARGDRPGAAEQYRRSLESDPARLSALERLADVAGSEGVDPVPLLGTAERAAEKNGDPRVLFALARLHQSVGEGAEGDAGVSSLARALELYRAILVTAPDNPEVLLRAASVADLLDDGAAVDFYTRAAAQPTLEPEIRAIAQNNAAYLLLGMNRSPDDLRKARTLSEAALAVARRAPFLDTQARIEQALGDRTRAATLFREAIQTDPGHAGARLGLAALLAEGDQGDREHASRVLGDLGAAVDSGSVKLSPEQARSWAELRTRLSGRK